MYMGLVLLLIVAVAMLTWKIPVRSRGLVSRDEEPKSFRANVVTCLILGLFFIGFSLVSFYLYGPPYF
jgi:hypothetical protein